jgi:cytochrome c biogenesis protein CcmG/thiol:disulfide interchange protein DsbE
MLDGRRTKLAELLGRNRPVLIEFWATWCAPCRRTMPHLDELGRKYDKQGLIVIGLTVEAPERDLDKVKELVQQLRINYPVAFATPPLYSFFSEGHARIGVPRVFVFARDGRLIKQINGYNPLNTLGKITNAVKQAALADVVLPKQK